MASKDESQDRATDRVPFASRVMVVHGESAWFAELLDLSETGCGIFRPEGWVLEEDELVTELGGLTVARAPVPASGVVSLGHQMLLVGEAMAALGSL